MVENAYLKLTEIDIKISNAVDINLHRSAT